MPALTREKQAKGTGPSCVPRGGLAAPSACLLAALLPTLPRGWHPMAVGSVPVGPGAGEGKWGLGEVKLPGAVLG